MGVDSSCQEILQGVQTIQSAFATRCVNLAGSLQQNTTGKEISAQIPQDVALSIQEGIIC